MAQCLFAIANSMRERLAVLVYSSRTVTWLYYNNFNLKVELEPQLEIELELQVESCLPGYQ